VNTDEYDIYLLCTTTVVHVNVKKYACVLFETMSRHNNIQKSTRNKRKTKSILFWKIVKRFGRVSSFVRRVTVTMDICFARTRERLTKLSYFRNQTFRLNFASDASKTKVIRVRPTRRRTQTPSTAGQVAYPCTQGFVLRFGMRPFVLVDVSVDDWRCCLTLGRAPCSRQRSAFKRKSLNVLCGRWVDKYGTRAFTSKVLTRSPPARYFVNLVYRPARARVAM